MSDAPHLPPGPPPGRASRRQLVLPGLIAIVLVVGIGAVLVLAQRAGDTGAPPRPEPFATPAPLDPMVVYSVQQVANGRLVLGDPRGSGSVDVELPAGATVELLRRAEFTDLNEGDWLVATGIHNEVRNFVIRELIAIPAADGADPPAFFRTPAGFLGHEAAADRDAMPVLGGIVTGVSPDRLVLDTGHTTVEITLDEHGPPPLRVLEEGSLEDVVAGSRLAIPAQNGQPDPVAPGILVALP